MGKGRFLLIAALLLFASSAHGQEAKEIESNLKQTMEALQTVSKESLQLRKKERKLKRELRDLQKELVDIVRKVQRQEKALSEMETRLSQLKNEEKAIISDLAEKQEALAPLLQSMMKLSHVPPELVVAMPGDFSQTLRTAKVLGLTSTTLAEKSRPIREKLEEVRALQSRIRENHEAILHQKEMLEDDQEVLQAKLGDRTDIQNQLRSEKQKHDEAMQRLSARSNTLKELLTELEKHRDRTSKLAVIPKLKPSHLGEEASLKATSQQESTLFAEAKGKISLPAEGKIFSFYGDKINGGNSSRGITIRTRENAQVSAPFDGEVVYTGPFLAYGNMVIIRHAGAYHTLIAGLANITCQPEQKLLKGEPVGEMGNTEDTTALYMEIRHNNQPTDPMPWLDTTTHMAQKLKHQQIRR